MKEAIENGYADVRVWPGRGTAYIVILDSAEGMMYFDSLERDGRPLAEQVEERLSPDEVWQELPNTMENRTVLKNVLAAMEQNAEVNQ